MELLKELLELAADSVTTVGLTSGSFKGGQSYHAVDIEPACRSVLRSSKVSPVHVFGDLLELLQPNIRVELLRIVETHEELLKPMIEAYKAKKDPPDQGVPRVNRGYQKCDRKIMKDQITKMGELLLDDLMTAMGKLSFNELFVHEAKCFKHHGQRCEVFPDASVAHAPPLDLPDVPALDAGLRILMAGTSCVDWSSMGAQLALAGKSVIPFSVQLMLVKHWKPCVWFHECTRHFDPKIFQKHLPGYNCHSAIQRPTARLCKTQNNSFRLQLSFSNEESCDVS